MGTGSIEDFQARDTDELVRMWRASFEHGVGIRDPHSLAEQAAYLRDEVLPGNRVRIVRQDGAITGFLAANDETIAQLYVRVENIGQGIGSRLLRLAKDESSGTLSLFTFARNVRACRFYERQGFVAVARGFEPLWQLEDVQYRWMRTGPSAALPR